MSRIFTFLLVFCCPALLSAAGDANPPSDAARGMCGAMGTVTYIPADWGPRLVVENSDGPTTWWKDTDGIAPGVAGCHLGTDADGKPNGRMFGEACLSDELLVESNPGKASFIPTATMSGIPTPSTATCGVVGKVPRAECVKRPTLHRAKLRRSASVAPATEFVAKT